MSVFSLPIEFESKLPKLNWKNIKKYHADNDTFISEVANWCKARNPNQEHVGETIDFSVADGKAVYIVAALKPVQLIHLPLGDGYGYEFAHRLTKKDIVTKIVQGKRLKELFGK